MRPWHSDGVLHTAATRTCMPTAAAQQPAVGRVSDHLCSVPEGSAADSRGSKRRKDSGGASAKKRPSKSKTLPFAQGTNQLTVTPDGCMPCLPFTTAYLTISCGGNPRDLHAQRMLALATVTRAPLDEKRSFWGYQVLA